MEHMTAQPAFEAHFPSDRALTWEDLQSIPDDQHWAYELVEGSLLVSPSPDRFHQRAVLRLARLLDDACPRDLEVLVAPFDFTPRTGYSLLPDVLVVRRATVERQRTVDPPRLAVEVLSPSSRSIDRVLKRVVYEEHGVPAYWIVDPESASLLVLEREQERYVERVHVVGFESYDAQVPFPVSVTPAALVAE
jgi:Uma2 family endonuclease